MRTGDDRVWAPLATKSAEVRQGAAKRPILSVRSFWQRVDPRADEK